jgi:hypothetical protein
MFGPKPFKIFSSFIDLGGDPIDLDLHYTYQLTAGIVAEECAIRLLLNLQIESETRLVLRYVFLTLHSTNVC